MEDYRVVEESLLGFSFERYADTEADAMQIISRLMQERSHQGRGCRARVEVRVGQVYRPLDEQPKLLLPRGHHHHFPIGARSIPPDTTEAIEAVMERNLAPLQLRSIGGREGVFLTEFRTGMTLMALKERGNFNSPIPLTEIDCSRDKTDLDERLQERPPIRQGWVVSATVRNESSSPVAVALFLSGIPEREA
jgi:hypothetical protein